MKDQQNPDALSNRGGGAALAYAVLRIVETTDKAPNAGDGYTVLGVTARRDGND